MIGEDERIMLIRKEWRYKWIFRIGDGRCEMSSLRPPTTAPCTLSLVAMKDSGPMGMIFLNRLPSEIILMVHPGAGLILCLSLMSHISVALIPGARSVRPDVFPRKS